MTSRTAGSHGRSRRALAVAMASLVLGGAPTTAAADRGGGAATSAPPVAPVRAASAAPAPTFAPLVTLAPPADAAPAPDLRAYRVQPGDEPSQMYQDTVANESRSFRFVPGGRVTVGFRPRSDDTWTVGGTRSRALPAGRESGMQMAVAPAVIPAPTPRPGAEVPPQPMPVATPDPPSIPARATALVLPGDPVQLAPAAVGMRRDVYGFLPYWELADPDTRLDFSVLTHVAYFSVGADAKGNLSKRNRDGSLTTGWGGWTSARMTSVINAAHLKRSRVTLTLSVFAWTSGQVAIQKALLGSAGARLNLARQAVAAVRDRGADGINLDFEPLVAGYEDEFVALIRTIRAELDKVAKGYHLSFDTLGYPGNYPLERALAPGGADTVFIMGYDYRTAGASYAGSIDPLAGPAYDLTDTVRTYTARVPASRVILGIPYYGRAWSTVSDAVNARTQTGARYGYSSAVNYSIAVTYAADYGRRYDGREMSAWTAFRKQSCTTASGCVMTWRQIYYDDAATLMARYDMVNREGLRGAGIWALGYDGSRRELYQALADKFLRDTTAPQAGIVAFSAAAQPDEGFVVRWKAVDDWSGIAGVDVQVSVDGGAWATWMLATKATSATYLGADGHGYAFRVRARDGKGNVSPWNVASVYARTPTLATGGFLRVTADNLNLRSAPDTSATRVATASRDAVFAITGGPATADRYTWYQVSGPISTWAQVGDVNTSIWVAASGPGGANAVPVRAPNVAVVGAAIRSVGFSSAGAASRGTSPAAVGARSFSPDGNGSGDLLAIRWNNRLAFDKMTLRVLRSDGSLAGTRPLSQVAAGVRDYAWDGTIGGKLLPDGRYVLQLVGVDGASTYTWPADAPTAGSLPAEVGVTIDRVPPTMLAAAASGARLSPNGDGKYELMKVTGTGSADAVRWDLVVAPVVGGASGSPIRTIAGAGRSVSTSWNGKTDAGAVARDGAYVVTLRVFDAAGNHASRSWPALVDASGPRLSVAALPAAFSPDADGAADAVRLGWSSGEPISGSLRVLRGTTVVRSWSVSGRSGALTWNGRDTAGRLVRDGRLAVVLAAADGLANRASTSTTVVVDRAIGWLRWSATSFFPQDGDRLSPTASISVRVGGASHLTLRILDQAGHEVRRAWTSRSFSAGTASWRWDGRTSGGSWVPQGRYVAELSSVGPLGTTVLRRVVYAGAFLATPSTATPRGRTSFSLTFRSVEPLGGVPRATFRQAGRAAVPMAVVRRTDGTWRASVTVAAGAPGPAVVTIAARDGRGGTNTGRLDVNVR